MLLGLAADSSPAIAEALSTHGKQKIGLAIDVARSASVPYSPTGSLETFESYTLGQLAPQGGWFNISDTNDRVVNGPFTGKAARHFATGANSGSLQILSWDFPIPSYYGDFSMDVVVSGGGTSYSVGVCDDFVAGSCRLHNTLTFALGGVLAASNDLVAASSWLPGASTRVGWRVSADGSVISFVNGRAFSVAGSEAAIARGVMNPMGVFISRSGNQGSGTADGGGDTFTIDNLDTANVAFVDPPGFADLLHGGSLGPYVQTMGRRRWPSWIATLGEALPWYLFAYNSASQASQAAFVAVIPASMNPTSGCGGSAIDNILTTGSQVVPPTGVASCVITLVPNNIGDYALSSNSAPTVPDPHAGNDAWSGTVRVLNPLPGRRCKTSGGENCPGTIGEAAGAALTSSMTVSDCPLVTDLNIGLALNHTYSGDLTVTLQPPGGAPVTIVDEVCSSSRFLHLQTTVDDDASAVLGASCPAQLRDRARPQVGLASAFAALQSVAGNGVWTLRVTDAYNEDGGVLDDWSLELSCANALFSDGFEPANNNDEGG
jgi:subtilisin-like proprotein convertase family protein